MRFNLEAHQKSSLNMKTRFTNPTLSICRDNIISFPLKLIICMQEVFSKLKGSIKPSNQHVLEIYLLDSQLQTNNICLCHTDSKSL